MDAKEWSKTPEGMNACYGVHVMFDEKHMDLLYSAMDKFSKHLSSKINEIEREKYELKQLSEGSHNEYTFERNENIALQNDLNEKNTEIEVLKDKLDKREEQYNSIYHSHEGFKQRYLDEREKTNELESKISELQELPVKFAEFITKNDIYLSTHLEMWVNKNDNPICTTTSELLNSPEFKQYLNEYKGKSV